LGGGGGGRSMCLLGKVKARNYRGKGFEGTVA
jgi:hypothetical protein